ncbi:hypothetical protein SAMN02799624_00971 [Paenibacillus sp. UNC496MF]|uniref:hypothetical protein n=1 Tax=Paenibacillus sp. UNC496MF TaxID=1502753 RepID=UPI0008EC9878|nr:hypothetical protein [Paenibacillus sp. UNC496MF]SFI48340.1 hypothetical protein SAMN02799624_00971 [Paenibacillus sp. UNC496MF]
MPIMIPARAATEETVAHDPRIRPLQAALPHVHESAWGLEFLRKCSITRIECFQFGAKPFGREADMRGLIALSTNTGIVGLQEFAVPRKSLKGDLVMWAAPFQRMKGMNMAEGIRFPQLKKDVWGTERVAFIESAFVDLIDKYGRKGNEGEERSDYLDRAWLFEHAQAYVAF